MEARSVFNPYFTQVLLASLCFAFGGLAMKYSQGLTVPWPTFWLFALFVAGAALQTVALRHTDLSITYVVVLGLEAVVATLLGMAFFQEGLSLTKAGAIGLIVTGIALLK